MASAALSTWRVARARRLDELLGAHERVGGAERGRRTRTEQINWALVLRLAAEFQGFARDLHGEGVGTFAEWAANGNPGLERTVRTSLTVGLKLDRGNAEPGSLGDAFGRLGVDWWPTLANRDERTPLRQQQLERLNRARNAIAHARLDELDILRSEGYPPTLATVRSWRSALSGLATTMDNVLAVHLSNLFGRNTPW